MADFPNFGKLSKAYDSVRIGYPENVMNHVFSIIQKNSLVLDIGCGTGISTRQLAEYYSTIGCDCEEKMIEVARSYDKIQYLRASAEKLPFADNAFDVVTAFAAFHWFCDDASVKEIERVLQPQGLFIVVNKWDLTDFRDNIVRIVEKSTGKKVPPWNKEHYDPVQILRKHGFSVEVKEFFTTEHFTIEKAILRVQSMSLWNIVGNTEKTTEALRKHFEHSAVNDIVEQPLRIQVVAGECRKVYE